MIEITDKTKCTGCTACLNACAHYAISMRFDGEGHSYPQVEKSSCVDCGLCEKVCPVLHAEELLGGIPDEKPEAYAVYNRNEEVRRDSTSGGLFTAIADHVLAKGGIVFAARFDKDFHIMHEASASLDEIHSYRGSKYAQSDLGDTFNRIKSFLRNGRHVLFVGAPCQVAGLKAFLRKDYDRLFTCDFICMCISSPKIWEEYLSAYWDRPSIKRIVFKDKRTGWHNWRMLVEDDRGEHLVKGVDDPFFHSYLLHYTSRPSCYRCPFRRVRHLSDVTIADCWGIDKVNPAFDDNKGCTTLILQTQKGTELFGSIKDSLKVAPYGIENVLKYNRHIACDIFCPPERAKFYRLYQIQGIRQAMEWMMRQSKPSISYRIWKRIKSIFKS